MDFVCDCGAKMKDRGRCDVCGYDFSYPHLRSDEMVLSEKRNALLARQNKLLEKIAKALEDK